MKTQSMINVTRPFMPPIKDYVRELEDIWETSWVTNNGPKCVNLENQLTDFLKVKNLNLFVNGTMALYLAIKALDLKGEIITTPFTFAATAHAISLNGLKPVFCDIEPYTLNINPEEIEKLITKKTSAIIPVHVFGNPCDIEKIQQIADKYGLKVIYDAAHAFGVEINSKAIGDFGDISMFSLHSTKVFHTIEGGILTYKETFLREKLEKLRNFGIYEEEIELIGTNAKMNEFQAAMGLVNLKYINEIINKRKTLTNTYRELLGGNKGIRYLKDIKGVKHNYSYFPIILNEEYPYSREELIERLAHNQINTKKYFYPLCTNFKCYNYNTGQYPIAEGISENILTLPLSTHMNEYDVEHICRIINSY